MGESTQPAPPRSGLQAVLARYSGKKFALATLGILSIDALLYFYLELAGAQYALSDVVTLISASITAIAIICAGVAIGQGLAERKPRTGAPTQ